MIMGKIVGLDVGDVRIGIAVCDEMRLIASPHSVYRRVGFGPDVKHIKALCDHPAFLAGGQDLLQGSIGDAICAGICGTWISSAVKEKLGDNYAACKLPTFTCGGEQVQMGSFLGCKILGVNTQTAHPVEAMELAEYLTNEQSQLRRFEALGYGPSNVNVAASEAVASEPALAALAAQSAYAISQHVLGGYWTPAGAFGAELVAHNGSDLQAMLDQLVEQTVAAQN